MAKRIDSEDEGQRWRIRSTKKGRRIEAVGRDGFGTILRSRVQSDVEDCELAKRSKEGGRVRPQAGAGFAQEKCIRDGPYSVVIKIA